MDPFKVQFNNQLVSAYKHIMRVEELMLRDLSGADLSISEMHMLESIGKSRECALHISDIALEQGITLPSVTQMVQRLERKGYVIKQRNAFDGRRVGVTLSEKGRRAEIAHRYFHRQMINALLAGLSEDEQVSMMSGLDKLNAFLQEKIQENQHSQGGESL